MQITATHRISHQRAVGSSGVWHSVHLRQKWLRVTDGMPSASHSAAAAAGAAAAAADDSTHRPFLRSRSLLLRVELHEEMILGRLDPPKTAHHTEPRLAAQMRGGQGR